jgi:hypothetical protein
MKWLMRKIGRLLALMGLATSAFDQPKLVRGDSLMKPINSGMVPSGYHKWIKEFNPYSQPEVKKYSVDKGFGEGEYKIPPGTLYWIFDDNLDLIQVQCRKPYPHEAEFNWLGVISPFAKNAREKAFNRIPEHDYYHQPQKVQFTS